MGTVHRQRRAIGLRWRAMVFGVSIGVGLFVTTPGSFVYAERPWDLATPFGPDAKTNGWYFNLGVTGVRVQIPYDEDNQTIMIVKYVFEGSPGSGKIKVDDVIVGVGGKRFKHPQEPGGKTYDRRRAFGEALESAMGDPALRGKLAIEIKRGDKKQTVELKIPTDYGRYAETFPYDCPKTDKVFKDICEYLSKTQGRNGDWGNRGHINCFAALTLLGSGEKKYLPQVKRTMEHVARITTSKVNRASGGFDSWTYAFSGIMLAEYYLATGEKWVLPELQEINEWLVEGQYANGGWGHRPWLGEGGKNGYGAFCAPTALGLMSWSLMARCGLEINRDSYRRAHEFLQRGTNRIGYVWYKDGVKNQGAADPGRTGTSAVAHYVSPIGGKSFLDYAKLSSKCIGDHPGGMLSSHAGPLVTQPWIALGAAIDPKNLQRLMAYNRYWFVTARCHDGSFYYQPLYGDPQDYIRVSPRLSATAAVGLIYALKEKRLAVTGAMSALPGFDESLLTKRTRPIFDQVVNERFRQVGPQIEQIEQAGDLTDAEKESIALMEEIVNDRIDLATGLIENHYRVGDVVKAFALVTEYTKKYGRIERFDKVVKPIQLELRTPEKRKEIALGKRYELMLKTAMRTKKESHIKALERFASNYADSVYAKAAAEAARRLREDADAAGIRDRYFEELLKELD